MTFRGAWRAIAGYFDHPDRRVALGGTVALIVVGNQPFYPFYVWYAAGMLVPAAFLTWLSAPLFAAAPAVARRAPGLGRGLLLAAALGNTLLSAVALGPATGIELFYIPSLLVAWATFAPGERSAPVGVSSAAALVGLWASRQIAPLAGLSPPQEDSLVTMNAISVVSLTAIIAFQAWRLTRGAAGA